MAEQSRLDVLRPERLAQQRIVPQVDLARRSGSWRHASSAASGLSCVGDERSRPLVRRAPLARAHCAGDAYVELIHGSCSLLHDQIGAVCRAIIRSSSVGITRTTTRLASLEMIGACAALRAGSTSRPRYPRPSQMRARIAAACSPMPAVKTSVSRPPSAATERAKELPRLVAEQRDRLGGARISRLARQQVLHVGGACPRRRAARPPC